MILPLSVSWPPASLRPYCFSSFVSSAAPSMPAGTLTTVKPSAGWSANNSRPSACTPARAAAAMRACRAQTFSMPSARSRFRLTRSARSSVLAGVNGVSLVFELVAVLLQVEVEDVAPPGSRRSLPTPCR